MTKAQTCKYPVLSKIYVRLTFDQLSWHVNKILSKLLCGFRKAYNKQYALFRLPQSLQKVLGNSEYVGTGFKLEAYSLNKTNLNY